MYVNKMEILFIFILFIFLSSVKEVSSIEKIFLLPFIIVFIHICINYFICTFNVNCEFSSISSVQYTMIRNQIFPRFQKTELLFIVTYTLILPHILHIYQH